LQGFSRLIPALKVFRPGVEKSEPTCTKSKEKPCTALKGVEVRSSDDAEIREPADQEQLEGGPAMSAGGAIPSGSVMNHWATASPNADATRPATMPHTVSTALPGETEDRVPV